MVAVVICYKQREHSYAALCTPGRSSIPEDWLKGATVSVTLFTVIHTGQRYTHSPLAINPFTSRTVDHLKQKDFGITNFHESASVKKVSINFGGKGNRKQIAFCPYCGIHYENNETALSHLCQHLSLEFLCGGCLTSRHLAPGTLGRHMSHCGAIPAVAKPKTRSSVRN